jgi:hypothetical protein
MSYRRTLGSHPPTLAWLLKQLVVRVWVLLGVFAVVGYAAGWIVVRHDGQSGKETIEIDTGQVNDAAKRAVEEGKLALRQLRSKAKTPVPPAVSQPAAPPAASPAASLPAAPSVAPDRPGAVPAERPAPDAVGKMSAPPTAPKGGP